MFEPASAVTQDLHLPGPDHRYAEGGSTVALGLSQGRGSPEMRPEMSRRRSVAHRVAGLVVLFLVAVSTTACRDNPSSSATPTDAATLGFPEPQASAPEDIDWLCGLSGDLDDSVPQHWYVINFYPESAYYPEGRSLPTGGGKFVPYGRGDFGEYGPQTSSGTFSWRVSDDVMTITFDSGANDFVRASFENLLTVRWHDYSSPGPGEVVYNKCPELSGISRVEF